MTNKTSKNAKRRRPSKKGRTKSKRPVAGGRFELTCAPVTAEELHFAALAGQAAAKGRTPRQSFESRFEETAEKGLLDPTKSYLRPTDIPENHMAFAIMEAFPEKTPEGETRRRSLLWRVMFGISEVLRDARAKTYIKEEDGQGYINYALLEALATTPMTIGRPIPVDEVFVIAARLLEADNTKDTPEL